MEDDLAKSIRQQYIMFCKDEGMHPDYVRVLDGALAMGVLLAQSPSDLVASVDKRGPLAQRFKQTYVNNLADSDKPTDHLIALDKTLAEIFGFTSPHSITNLLADVDLNGRIDLSMLKRSSEKLDYARPQYLMKTLERRAERLGSGQPTNETAASLWQDTFALFTTTRYKDPLAYGGRPIVEKFNNQQVLLLRAYLHDMGITTEDWGRSLFNTSEFRKITGADINKAKKIYGYIGLLNEEYFICDSMHRTRPITDEGAREWYQLASQTRNLKLVRAKEWVYTSKSLPEPLVKKLGKIHPGATAEDVGLVRQYLEAKQAQ